MTAKATAKSRLLSACWFGELSEIFAKASRTCECLVLHWPKRERGELRCCRRGTSWLR